MSRQKRAPSTTARAAIAVRGGGGALRDLGSRELARMADKLGNDRLTAAMGNATAKRDAVLEFIETRLARVAEAQRIEQAEMLDREDWWRAVGRGKEGLSLPDPTRWRGAARAYKRALEALGAGQLGRAVQLLDEAVEADRAAHASVPDQVQLPRHSPARMPDVQASPGEGCIAPDVSPARQLADRIIRVSDTSDPVPMARASETHQGWWAEEEEEEEPPDEPKKKPKRNG